MCVVFEPKQKNEIYAVNWNRLIKELNTCDMSTFGHNRFYGLSGKVYEIYAVSMVWVVR